MEEWKTYKLGDIASVQTGPFGSQLHNEDYVSVGTPIVTVEHLGARKFSKQNLPRVSKEDKERLSKYSLQEGDIVFSRVGSVDRCSYVSHDEDGWLFSGRCLRVRSGNLVCPLFLYYYFQKESVKQEIRNVAVGATMPSINTKLLSDLTVILPPITEQKRIAGILSYIDDKIELNNRINHNLEEQIQERFDSMIISDNGLGYCQIADYVDVNPKRSLRKNEPAKCVDMSYLSTTGPFPSGWETKGYNGGMKFFNGDTIMARITPCLENGKVAYVNFLDDGETAFGSTEFIVLHAKEGVDPVFTYFLVRNKNFVDYATKNMNGSSGRQRVSGDTIGKYMIPVIDSHSLNEFSGFATPAMEVIRNNSFESRSLAATRDALLPLLLSGELSISQMNC